jgi:hypothetical protein
MHLLSEGIVGAADPAPPQREMTEGLRVSRGGLEGRWANAEASTRVNERRLELGRDNKLSLRVREPPGGPHPGLYGHQSEAVDEGIRVVIRPGGVDERE